MNVAKENEKQHMDIYGNIKMNSMKNNLDPQYNNLLKDILDNGVENKLEMVKFYQYLVDKLDINIHTGTSYS